MCGDAARSPRGEAERSLKTGGANAASEPTIPRAEGAERLADPAEIVSEAGANQERFRRAGGLRDGFRRVCVACCPPGSAPPGAETPSNLKWDQ